MPFGHLEDVAETEFPKEWQSYAWPKQTEDAPVDLATLKLVQVGFSLVPEYFSWAIHVPEMYETGDEHVGIIVSFQATEGSLRIMMVLAANLDLDDWLGFITERFPMEHWKSAAKQDMARWLAQDEVRRLVPQLADSVDRPKVGLTKAPAAARRKRYRITPDHLKEVTRIYSEAAERGEPPTRAVADTFDVAHSTAAKWVGAARREGLLEGVAQKWGTKTE